MNKISWSVMSPNQMSFLTSSVCTVQTLRDTQHSVFVVYKCVHLLQMAD